MALKFKLDSLDGLDDATKKLYKKEGEKFVLDMEGGDGDTGGLKTQVETLLTETKDLKKRLQEKNDTEAAAKEAERKAREEAAAKSGDIDALRKSSEERVAAAKTEAEGQYKPQIEKLNTAIRKQLVNNVALDLATKIGLKGSESVLLPHIVGRLEVEERNGDFVTVVRGADGKASTLSVDDLGKEFSANAAFQPLLASTSKASGSGAGGSKQAGGGAAGAKTKARSDFDALNPAEKAAFMKEGGTVTDSAA